MGLMDIGSVVDDRANSGDEVAAASAGYDEDLFSSSPVSPIRWLAEARALLNEALEKTPQHVRGPANHRAQSQIEALARQQGMLVITAELVGLAMGGMSSIVFADENDPEAP